MVEEEVDVEAADFAGLGYSPPLDAVEAESGELTNPFGPFGPTKLAVTDICHCDKRGGFAGDEEARRMIAATIVAFIASQAQQHEVRGEYGLHIIFGPGPQEVEFELTDGVRRDRWTWPVQG
jgi:hypothetical protein